MIFLGVSMLRQWPQLMIGLLCTLISGCEQNEPTVQENRENLRPPILHAFSRESCYRESFPQTEDLDESAIPPEVRFHCSAPWNMDGLDSVRKALNDVGFNAPQALANNQPEETRDFTITAINFAIEAASLGPDGLLSTWYAVKFLPILHAIRFGSKSVNYKVIEMFTITDYKKLEAAALKIDWKQPAYDANQPFISFKLLEPPPSSKVAINIFLDTDTKTSLFEIAPAILTSGIPDTELATLGPFATNARRFLNEYLPPVLAANLSSLSVLAEYLISRAEDLVNAPTKFRPDFLKREKNLPLEIYLLKKFPKDICGGLSDGPSAMYCSDTNQIFVRAGIDNNMLDDLVEVSEKNKLLVTRYPAFTSAALIHELSHALFDPTDRDSQPFLVEGRATVEGEQARRAMTAALKLPPKIAKGYFSDFLSALQDLSDNEVLNKVEARVHQKVSQQDPTNTERKLLAFVSCKSPTLDFVINQLSLSNNSFRAQDKETLGLSYAVSWALHSIGQLTATTAQPDRKVDQEDLMPLYNVAIKLNANEPLTQDDQQDLKKLLIRAQDEAKNRFQALNDKCSNY